MAVLCFDAYGTIFDPETVRTRLAERLDAPAGVVDAVVARWRDRQLTYASHLALMDDYRPFRAVTDAALRNTLDYYGFELRAVDVDAAMAAYETLAPFDDVDGALDRLADADHRLAVLSNGGPAMLDAVIGNAGLDGAFEAVVSADEVETFKPAPAVYERAAERLEVPIADCLMVSANGWDAGGAAQAGMDAAWVNRANEPPERIGGEITLTADSLAALADELA